MTKSISLHDQIENLKNFMDDSYAIPGRIVLGQSADGNVDVYQVTIYYNVYFGSKLRTFVSQGTHLDSNVAMISAICEGFERYCLHLPIQKSRVVRKSFANLNCDFMSFNEVVELQGFDDEVLLNSKLNRRKISTQNSIDWLLGTELLTGKKKYVPLDYCVLRTNSFFDCTSNGCAIGSNYESAIISACLELIERDTFMYFWYTKQTPIFVNKDSNWPESTLKVLERFGKYKEKVKLFTIEGLFKIPCFYAFFEGDSSVPGEGSFFMGGAAHFSAEIAMNKALYELAAMLNYHASPSHKEEWESNISSFNEILTFSDISKFYSKFENKKYIFFLSDKFNRNEVVIQNFQNLDQNSNDQNLKYLKDEFSRNDFNPIVVDQSSDDIKELGLHVVRVLEPRMMNLNSAHAARSTLKSRLSNIKVNPYPHPYP